MKIWEIHPRLFLLVRQSHDAIGMDGTGHPFDHVLQVAQAAMIIAENDVTARLAGAAALCHNVDRLLQKQKGSDKTDSAAHASAAMIPEAESVAMIGKWLEKSGEFSPEEARRVTEAARLHNAFNIEGCDSVLVALQDADRVVCSMASAMFDAAQFWDGLPGIDPQWITADPKDTQFHSYRKPKSVAHNLQCRFDWIDKQSKVCVRLPRALKMMERRVEFYRQVLAEIASQRAEIDLFPEYPTQAQA